MNSQSWAAFLQSKFTWVRQSSRLPFHMALLFRMIHYKFRFRHCHHLHSLTSNFSTTGSSATFWKQLSNPHTKLLSGKQNLCCYDSVKRKFGTWKTLTFSSIFFFSSLDLFEICFTNSLSCNPLFSAAAIFRSSSRWDADLSETWGCSGVFSYCGCLQKKKEIYHTNEHTE